MSVVKKCFKLLQLKQHFEGVPEREVVAYLRNWNRNLKSDDYGNLYLINPGTPLLCAHMDTVQRQDSVDNLHTLRLNNGIIKAKDAVIGGDDKCGIAIAMEIYEKLGNKVSLLFTRQEEVGCLGASSFCLNHSDLVKECKYCIVLDRRGAGDIIGYQNQYCSKEFENKIAELIKDFGYKPTSGFCSDTKHIANHINGVNLSVGYYNPHRKDEYIKCDELVNACNAAMYIVNNFEGEYEIYKAPSYPSTYRKSYFEYDDSWDDYGDKKYYRGHNGKQKQKESLFDTDVLSDYFQIEAGGIIRVKKNIFLANILDDSDWAELSKGQYQICEL